MINKLQEISREINSAQNLSRALDIAVKKICSATHAEICSIYYADHINKQYILLACEGPQQRNRKPGPIPFYRKVKELVNKEEKTSFFPSINPQLDFSESHNIDNNEYTDFLGAPIVYRGYNYGHLVVQNKNSKDLCISNRNFITQYFNTTCINNGKCKYHRIYKQLGNIR